MDESTFAGIGCIVCPIFIIMAIVKMFRIFKINDQNSETTKCTFTHVLRIKYFIITYWVNYRFQYTANDIGYEEKVSLPPFCGFSDDELENGVEVRYLKSDPRYVELTHLSHTTRLIGWLIFIAFWVTAEIFCWAIAFDL